MIRFEVIELDEGWGVFGVNPNNPDDKELATVCMDRAYAESRATALNRIAEIEPANTASNEPEAKPKQLLFDLESGEPIRRKISLED
jgi:hypothetical protein